MKKKIIQWIKCAGIRAIKTVAQTALGGLTTAVASMATLGDINWWSVISTALLAGIYSLLTSTVGLPEINKNESEGT